MDLSEAVNFEFRRHPQGSKRVCKRPWFARQLTPRRHEDFQNTRSHEGRYCAEILWCKFSSVLQVANVKLRPAQASSSRFSKRQSSLPRVGLHEEDTGIEEVDIRTGNKPFEGIVLCATGTLDKVRLQRQPLSADAYCTLSARSSLMLKSWVRSAPMTLRTKSRIS